MSDTTELERRRAIIRDAHVYFVCEARPGDRDPGDLLDAACRGGASLIQLRQKEAMSDEELIAAARPFREVADRHGALFFLNDRPELVAATGADGVHVGQDDTAVAQARAMAGPNAVVGLSTHTSSQVIAAQMSRGDARPDQISVGPVWATPTKPGRPATGLDLIHYAAGVGQAAGAGSIPWFAIGGIDAGSIGQVAEAGATRAVIVRAIRDASDPEAVTRGLVDVLAEGVKAG